MRAFTFNITPPSTPGSGSLILTVTTPGGIVTTAFYNLVPLDDMPGRDALCAPAERRQRTWLRMFDPRRL